MALIPTSDPPVATPKRYSGTAGITLASIISVDEYEVSTISGTETTVEARDGVAEISSPLFLCNKTAAACWITVQITRAGGQSAYIVFEQVIPPKETLQVALNGQFLLTGDLLRLQAQTVSSIDATISWTQGEAETNDGT